MNLSLKSDSYVFISMQVHVIEIEQALYQILAIVGWLVRVLCNTSLLLEWILKRRWILEKVPLEFDDGHAKGNSCGTTELFVIDVDLLC